MTNGISQARQNKNRERENSKGKSFALCDGCYLSLCPKTKLSSVLTESYRRLLRCVRGVHCGSVTQHEIKMTICGTTICYDDDAYCCLDDDGVKSCCVSFHYFRTWWFWFIWIIGLLILVSCFWACFRAWRRNHARYVILGQPQQPPVYGSVVVSSNVQSTSTVMPAPAAPMAPPPYAGYPQEKPPSYVVAQP